MNKEKTFQHEFSIFHAWISHRRNSIAIGPADHLTGSMREYRIKAFWPNKRIYRLRMDYWVTVSACKGVSCNRIARQMYIARSTRNGPLFTSKDGSRKGLTVALHNINGRGHFRWVCYLLTFPEILARIEQL